MQIKIGPHSQIWLGCQFVGDAIDQIEIGSHVVLASGVVINASAPIRIGDRVNIANGVQIITSDHDWQDPHFMPRKEPVTIHSNAWIGTRAIILKGVTIGDGAMVGAASVVSNDVKPLAIVAGNPGRQCGTRVKPASAESKHGRPPLFC